MSGKDKVEEVIEKEEVTIDKEVLNVHEISTPAEAERIQAIAESKKIEFHLKDEAKKIRAIKCSCGNSLKLKPKEFMVTDKSKAKKIECSKCHRYTRVQIQYKGNPENTEAIIKIKAGNFAWESDVPGSLSDENLVKWIAEEEEKIKNNQSSFIRREEQILVRCINLALKKLK